MKLVKKVLGVGILALLAGALVPHSSAMAQATPACFDGPSADLTARPSDPALAVIFCSERVECTALLCKDDAARKLLDCLTAANGSALAIRRCRAAALASLSICQGRASLGDAACYLNPNGGTPAPMPPPG